MLNSKILEDNIREHLGDLQFGSDFLGTTPEAHSMKEITDKLVFIKIKKNSESLKVTVKRVRRQATDKERAFASDTNNKRLLSELYKELLKLYNKKMNNLIKKLNKRSE